MPKYPKYVKRDYCEECVRAYDPWQLDVDHVNGDHYDNRLSNLRTLCANCHRAKTHEFKDWERRKKGWFDFWLT